MDNVFNKAAGASSNRKFNQAKGSRFSPSYGVHQGYIRDPNWPPAHFPEEGLANSRRFRRIPASFQVSVEGSDPITVTGNLSLGGVMFAMTRELNTTQIEVGVGKHLAAAEVVASGPKNALFVYRARFTDVDRASEIWLALMKLN